MTPFCMPHHRPAGPAFARRRGSRSGIPRAAARGAAWAAALLAAVLGLHPPAAGAAEACEKGLMGRVQASYQAVSSFRGRFRQIDVRSDGTRVEATGEIAYKRPGRMRWSYDPPHEQLLVTDGKTVWLFDPLLDNVTVQPLGDLTQGTPLSFLLGVGDLAADFTCRGLTRRPPDDGLAYLELLPRRPIPTLAFIQLGVRPKDARLEALLMVDTQGSSRLLRLLDLRRGVTFPPGFFQFIVRDDMEVITK